MKQLKLVLEDLVLLVHKLLALDQASVTSGWAYFEDDKLVKHGKFTATAEDIGERLHFIRQQVTKLIEEFDIDELVFEDIQLQESVNGQRMGGLQNVKTFKILAEVFGVIYELAVDLAVPHTAVLSGVWKANLGIRGKRRPEQKQNAQKYVIQKYGIKPTQDECDAICIGTYIVQNNIKIENDHDWTN